MLPSLVPTLRYSDPHRTKHGCCYQRLLQGRKKGHDDKYGDHRSYGNKCVMPSTARLRFHVAILADQRSPVHSTPANPTSPPFGLPASPAKSRRLVTPAIVPASAPSVRARQSRRRFPRPARPAGRGPCRGFRGAWPPRYGRRCRVRPRWGPADRPVRGSPGSAR